MTAACLALASAYDVGFSWLTGVAPWNEDFQRKPLILKEAGGATPGLSA